MRHPMNNAGNKNIYLKSFPVSVTKISVISTISLIPVKSLVSVIPLPAPASSSTTSSEASTATSVSIPSVSTKTASAVIHSVHSSGGRSYSDINEVSNNKLAIMKSLAIIWALDKTK